VTYPLLLNASSVVADYNTTYDRLVLIDKAKKIAFSGTQAASGDIQTVKYKIDELLN